MCKKSLLLLFLLPFQFVFAQTSLLTDFPEGYTPKEVGKRLAYHFVDGKHMLHIGKWISYPETFTWNGGLKFAALTNDQELVKLLQNRFELLFTTEKALLPIMNHVDVNMFGSLPLELYKIKGSTLSGSGSSLCRYSMATPCKRQTERKRMGPERLFLADPFVD